MIWNGTPTLSPLTARTVLLFLALLHLSKSQNCSKTEYCLHIQVCIGCFCKSTELNVCLVVEELFPSLMSMQLQVSEFIIKSQPIKFNKSHQYFLNIWRTWSNFHAQNVSLKNSWLWNKLSPYRFPAEYVLNLLKFRNNKCLA